MNDMVLLPCEKIGIETPTHRSQAATKLIERRKLPKYVRKPDWMRLGPQLGRPGSDISSALSRHACMHAIALQGQDVHIVASPVEMVHVCEAQRRDSWAVDLHGRYGSSN